MSLESIRAALAEKGSGKPKPLREGAHRAHDRARDSWERL
jgi:hypothetical protein